MKKIFMLNHYFVLILGIFLCTNISNAQNALVKSKLEFSKYQKHTKGKNISHTYSNRMAAQAAEVVNACGSYTWGVNGETYNTSGTYNSETVTASYNNLTDWTNKINEVNSTVAFNNLGGISYSPSIILTLGSTSVSMTAQPNGMYTTATHVATDTSDDDLIITFSPGVYGFSANIFLTNYDDDIISGDVTVTYSTGSSETRSVTSVNDFFGYTSTTPITSVTLASVSTASQYKWPSLNNLRLATNPQVQTLDLTVFPIPSAPTAEAQTLNTGATVDDLQPLDVGIKWYASADAAEPLSSAAALSTGTYYVSQTNANGCESERTAVAITISTNTPAPTVPSQTVCPNTIVADLQGEGYMLKWYSQPNDENYLNHATIVTTGTYYVSQTLNDIESERIQVAITVEELPIITANETETKCEYGSIILAPTITIPTTVNMLSTTGFTGDFAEGNWSTFAPDASNGSINFINSTIMTMIASNTGAGNFAPNSANIEMPYNALISFDWSYSSDDMANGDVPMIGTSSFNLFPFAGYDTNGTSSQSGTQIFSVEQGQNLMLSISSNDNDQSSTVTITNFQVTQIPAYIYSWEASNGGEFYDEPVYPQLEVNTSGTYTLTVTTEGGCSVSKSISVVDNIVAPPIAEATQTFCSGATVATLVAGGNNLTWHDANFAVIESTTVLLNGIYYVNQTIGGCLSEPVVVNVTISDIPTAPTASAQNFTTAATVAGLMPNGDGIKWYASADAAEPLSSAAALSTGTYYVSQTNANGCESDRTAVEVTVGGCTAPTLDTVTALPTCAGSSTNIVLSGMLPNTSGVATYTVNDGFPQITSGTSDANGTFSFATPALAATDNGSVVKFTKLTTTAGCETLFEDKIVTLVVNAFPTLGTATIAPACAGSTTTVTLSGLLPNITGTATYKLGPFAPVTISGTSDANGNFIFTTPVLQPAANGLVVSILNLTTDGGCSTNYTDKKVTVVVLPKPTLSSVSTSTVCENSPATIVLDGLLPNSTGQATYKVGNGPIQTAEGTSTAQGTFSFETPELPASADGLVVQITKIETDLGCFTNFTGKKVTLSVTEGPTLETVTSAYVCVNGTNKLKVVLSGLKPNTFHKIDFTRNGTARVRPNVKSNAAGKITITLSPAATLYDNGKIINITKLTNNATLCETNFTDKSVTLQTGSCATRGTTTKEKEEEAIADDLTSNVVTLYPNPTRDILNIDSAIEIKSIEILNMQGQRMLTTTQKQINVSNLPSGAYMIRIQDVQNNVTIKKVIKD